MTQHTHPNCETCGHDIVSSHGDGNERLAVCEKCADCEAFTNAYRAIGKIR